MHPLPKPLAEALPTRRRVLAGDGVNPTEVAASTRSVVTITRTGSFTDPRYDRFAITPAMLTEMVRNFEQRTLGQDVFLDVSHRPEDGAAARVLSLFVEDDRLRAEVEWTPYGVEAIQQRGFTYLSADYYERFVDNEAGKAWGCVLAGAGLTNRPVIKRLDPVRLCLAEPTAVLDRYLTQLSTETQTMWEQHLASLATQLRTLKLAETVVQTLLAGARKALANVTEAPAAEALLGEFETTGKQLAEQIGATPAPIQLSINAPAAPVDVSAEVNRQLAQREQETRQLADTLVSRHKLLADTINTTTALDEATRRQLCEAARPLVTAAMSEEQVKALAQLQIEQGKQLDIARQLSALGWRPAGSPQISVDSGNQVLALQITPAPV